MHEALVLQHAQNLGLRVHAHGGDFVEEERAAVGYFEEAFLRGDGGSKRAFDVAEERGLEQLGGHGAGVDGNERLVAARRVGVDGLGDDLLAGAALALNQDRGTAGRDLRDQVEDAQHDLAFAHDVGEVVALLEGALELKVFFLGAVAGNGGADVGEQLLVVPGLLDEVLRAGADGLDDVIDGAVGRDHDDGQIGLALLELRQQLEAALAGQSEIEEDEVEARLIEQAQPLLAVGRGFHGVVLEREQHFQRFADAGLVIDDQDGGGGRIAVECGRGNGGVQRQCILGVGSGMNGIP